MSENELTICWLCGKKSVQKKDLPYGIKWTCLDMNCDYTRYFSIGD